MADQLSSLGRYSGPATLILTSLAESSKHGYALTKDIDEFAGVYLAPGTLYAALDRLVELGLIEGLEPVGRRRPYKLTALGVTSLRSAFGSTAPRRRRWSSPSFGCVDNAMNRPVRNARRLLRWYPRSWRETHEAEFLALLEDSMSDRPFWPGRFFNVAVSGIRLRSAELRRSPRRALYPSSATVVVLLVIALATNGFGLLSSPSPSKGAMPYDPPRGPTYKEIPDYVAVYVNAHTTGYTPKAYVAAPNGAVNGSLLGRVAPVYASNLTTLLGHEYPGIGFVPTGQSPWAQPCHRAATISTSANGTVTTSTFPCPSTVLVLPKVSGMVTPTAVGELSGLGVDVVIVNVHSNPCSGSHCVDITARRFERAWAPASTGLYLRPLASRSRASNSSSTRPRAISRWSRGSGTNVNLDPPAVRQLVCAVYNDERRRGIRLSDVLDFHEIRSSICP